MKFIILALLGFIAIQAQSQDVAFRKSSYNLENGLAIQGYDPVAYFKQFKAVKGNPKFSYTYAGVTYHFSSEENRKAFIETPQKFEPEYGGWCAYAVGAYDGRVEIDPETFKIVNGKLYLFYNFYFTNTLNSWNKDESNLLNKANTNWNKVKK
jgi:YHS domain-containing protein